MTWTTRYHAYSELISPLMVTELGYQILKAGAEFAKWHGKMESTLPTRYPVFMIQIDYDQKSRFNAFDLIGIKLLLESGLAVPIDITTRDGLHPVLKAEIEKSAVRVF